MQIIIVAGGGGTRLWPASTKQNPKQFVPLLDNKTLLEHTFHNALQATDIRDIWVSTNIVHVPTVIGLLPAEFDPTHVIIQHEIRDSFPAVAAAAAVVSAQVGDDEPLIFIPCDDWLSDQNSIETFAACQKRIAEDIAAKKFDIMVAGIKPTGPNTNYGYIEVSPPDKHIVFETSVPVLKFKEKPNLETAKQFVTSGKYLWNKFNFAFTYRHFVSLLADIDPESIQVLRTIQTQGLSSELFGKLPKISFDFHILDHVREGLGVLGMDIRWDDLGNWDTIEKYLPELTTTPYTIQVDGSNNKARLLSEDKKIAFIGVSDVLVVETADGILICDTRNLKNIKIVAEHFDTPAAPTN
jgi:mannose-1-phosphate guanylyltransferase